jgi:leucyl-tRNA synthetase
MYNFIKKNLESQVSKKILQTNIIKLMKLMLPFTPHLANECLELQNCKTVNKWPKINTGNIVEEIKLAVQINGKTRDIITTKKDLLESKVNEIIHNNSKAKKYLENKKIIKTIFIKNKIINYIVK